MAQSHYPTSAELAAMRAQLAAGRSPLKIAREAWRYDGPPSLQLATLPEPDGDELPDGASEPFGCGAVTYVSAPAGAWWAWLLRAAAAARAGRQYWDCPGNPSSASDDLDRYCYQTHADSTLGAPWYAYLGETERGCPAGWKAGR